MSLTVLTLSLGRSIHPNPSVITRSKILFAQNSSSCHGVADLSTKPRYIYKTFHAESPLWCDSPSQACIVTAPFSPAIFVQLELTSTLSYGCQLTSLTTALIPPLFLPVLPILNLWKPHPITCRSGRSYVSERTAPTSIIRATVPSRFQMWTRPSSEPE